jgi:hypothetical protein
MFASLDRDFRNFFVLRDLGVSFCSGPGLIGVQLLPMWLGPWTSGSISCKEEDL